MKNMKIILYTLLFLFLVLPSTGYSDDSDYVIRVTYDGAITLHRVEVLLYDTDRACNTLVESPTGSPSTDVAWTSLVILPDPEGEIPDRGLNVPSEVEFHYAVARGEPGDESGGGKGYFVTFGCNDQIPATDPSQAAVIEISMHNLWPSVEGTYEITTEMDSLEVIPDQFDPVTKAIEGFLKRPGLGLLRLIALAAAGDQYWEADPWNRLFKCLGPSKRNYPYCRGKVLPTRLGKVAARILEKLINTNLSSFPGSSGSSIRRLLSQGSGVFDNVESFSMSGNLVITQDPDASGSLGNSNSIVFNQITWLWEGTERTISLGEESFLRASNIEASIVFHPDRAGVYSLEIKPFDLDLNYGELLTWVLEGIVFPEVIGEEINSFEDLFAKLVDCATLSDMLNCEGAFADDRNCRPGPRFVAETIRYGCELMQTSDHQAIESWIASLMQGIDTWYRIGTPSDRPCPMGMASGEEVSAFEVYTLGGPSMQDLCEWEGKIIIYPADEAIVYNGNWWGEKLNGELLHLSAPYVR